MKLIENIFVPHLIEKEILANSEQLTEFLEDKRSIFDPWLSKILGYLIVSYDAWVNYTSFNGDINGYEWHNEQGIGGAATAMTGECAGIIWLSGDENSGGNLSVLENDEVVEIKFKPYTLILIDSSTFHRVEHYYGLSTRISLNFTFSAKSC
jgi:hypothetical protein